MILENSPNVTHVDNNEIHKFIANQKPVMDQIKDGHGIATQVYAEKGIYVIDVALEDFKNISKAFDDYQEKGHLYPVTKSGLKYNDEASEVGSHRFCTNSQRLAAFLDEIIRESDAFPSVFQKDDKEISQYAGVSPYFRFMRYKTGGLHFPHYDSDYTFSKPNQRLFTAFSLVMYFSDCMTGELAFINDKTQHASDKSDWDRQANDDEIFLKVTPQKGRIVLFRHDLCHSVLELSKDDEDRMMVRGDLIFEKVA